MIDRPTNALIFDAECELCVWARHWLERWDRCGRIRFVPFQSEEFGVWFSDLDRSDPKSVWPDGAPPAAMLFVDSEGTVWYGQEAFRAMLPRLAAGRWAAWLYDLPGVSPLAARLYLWIARNRYRWFGNADCTACRLGMAHRADVGPQPENRRPQA